MSDLYNITSGFKIESALISNSGGIATTRDLRAKYADMAGLGDKDPHNVGKGKGFGLEV